MDAAMSPSMSGEESGGQSSKSWQGQDAPSPAGSMHSQDDDLPDTKPEESITTAGHAATIGAGAAMPVHKRRRVTRACDECRRKKIKCDGKQPCTHCSVYSYECTYDKPSNRRRNPAPQYIEAIENRLHRAETLLRKFMPDVDLSDPNLDPTVQIEFQNRERARAQAVRMRLEEQQQQQKQQQLQQQPPKQPSPQQQMLPNQQQRRQSGDSSRSDELISVIETMGQLDLTEGGEWDFHGKSSSSLFLRKMKENFQGLLGRDPLVSYLSRPERPPGVFTLDSPRSAASSPWDAAVPPYYTLPDKEHARVLCHFSLNCATCLLRFVHIPSFFEMFDRLYDKAPENIGAEDHRQLGLLFSVLSLGCMYNIPEEGESNPVDYKVAMDEGLKYYTNARVLLQDITECRDLTSLQALMFMILFLQATSNLSGCYSFIGIALRAALRMGLHRNLPHARLTPIERESRRRVFYVVRQMDTYVSALLGFPILLRDQDVDQPLPSEIDDEYITKDGIKTPPPGTPSFYQACNAYTRLMDILAKVIDCIYPVRGVEQSDLTAVGDAKSTYMISYSSIKDLERELHAWYEQLPVYWRPSPNGPIEVVRVRTLLRFAYAHVQMMMYRPFLHYVSPRAAIGQTIDERYYACAGAAVSISRNIVQIGLEIRKQAVLIGPYWFILYTEFFAILSLVYYALENPDESGSAEAMIDAKSGKAIITSLSKRSMAADRVTMALHSLFEQLPDHLKKEPRKRPASGPKSAPVGLPQMGPKMPRSDINRAAVLGQLRQAPPRLMSLDPIQQQQQLMQQQQQQQQQQHKVLNGTSASFVADYRNLLPLDIAPSTDSPESIGTPSTSHRSASGFPVRQATATSVAGGLPHSTSVTSGAAVSESSTSTSSNLYKFEAMMFPSNDPFAYPSHSPMDFDLQGVMGIESGDNDTVANGLRDNHGASNGGGSSGGGGAPTHGHQQQAQPSDAMRFYTPVMYGDIEGQLLGPVPDYLAQPSGAPTDLDLATQMYDTGSLLLHNAQQQQQVAHAQHQSHQQHQHRQPQHPQQHMHQQQQRELEELLAGNNFDLFSGTYQSI